MNAEARRYTTLLARYEQTKVTATSLFFMFPNKTVFLKPEVGSSMDIVNAAIKTVSMSIG